MTPRAGLHRAWEEAGKPAPTPEQIEEHERESQLPEMVGAGGPVPTADLPAGSPVLIWADAIQPPAKHLTVLMEKGLDSHEYHPLFVNGLTLPPLRVAA